MDKELKTILGVALLYTLITSIFSLISKLGLIFTSTNLIKGLQIFFGRSMLLIITAAAIIDALILYSKKLNLDIRTDVLNNQIVCLSAGILVSLNGVISLSSFLPIFIFSIQSLIDTTHRINMPMNFIIRNIAENSISVIAILLQIFVGIYFIKRNKRNIV